MPVRKIIHSKSQRRFEFHTKAGEAYAAYQISDKGEFDISFVTVPKHLEGLGLGKTLVKAAADYALAQGYFLTASCPFAHRALRLPQGESTNASGLEATS